MPFMTKGRRDYKKELTWEHQEKPSRVKDRAKRNQARKAVGLKVGDSRQVDHKRPLNNGGSNKKSNLRVVSAKTNLTTEAMMKKRNG